MFKSEQASNQVGLLTATGKGVNADEVIAGIIRYGAKYQWTILIATINKCGNYCAIIAISGVEGYLQACRLNRYIYRENFKVLELLLNKNCKIWAMYYPR